MSSLIRVCSIPCCLISTFVFFILTASAQDGREDIINAVNTYSIFDWDCSEENWNKSQYFDYGDAVYDNGNLIAQAHYSCDFGTGWYWGLPYAYGWDDDPSSFNNALSQNCGAGNHKCHYLNYGNETNIYPPDWSTGIDCSGLVCNCWEISRTNTCGLASIGYNIDNESVQMGDILVKCGSHAVIVETAIGGTVWLYEASGSSPYVVHNTSRDMSYFNSNNYIARSKFVPETSIPPSEGEIFVYQPSNLNATINGGNIQLSWTASQGGTYGNVSGYKIYKGVVVNGRYCYDSTIDVGDVTSYLDTDVNSNTTYCYKIAACSENLYIMLSQYSNEISINTPCSGSIVGYVKNGSTGSWIQNAYVKLYTSYGSYTGKSDYTNFGGYFEIDEIDNGNYYLLISKTGFNTKREPISGSFNVPCDEIVNRGIINLIPSCAQGKVKGWVEKCSSGDDLVSALVKLYTSGGSYTSKYDYTDTYGFYQINNIDTGDYYVMISKSGYVTKREPSSGSFNIACGETENRGTVCLNPSNPPPGCPYVYHWNGEEYVEGSNILVESENSSRIEIDVVDYYKVEQQLIAKNTMYCFQIREFEQEHSWLDQFELLTLDHPKGLNLGVTKDGDIFLYKRQINLSHCFDNNENNCLVLINSIDERYFDGYQNDWLILDFGYVVNIEDMYLEVLADLKPPPDKEETIAVQIENQNGWEDIEKLHPRENWATHMVKLAPWYENTSGEIILRLYWLAHHKVDYIGLAQSSPGPIKEKDCLLISAIHSEAGVVTDSLISMDGNYAELLPGENIGLNFSVSPEENEGFKRDFILVAKGHYVTEVEGIPKQGPNRIEHELPTEFSLSQNYPNPFNPRTEINFCLPEDAKVKVTIYNILGHIVEVLYDSEMEAGYHTVHWNGENVVTGVYFYRLTAGEFIETKRMLLLK